MSSTTVDDKALVSAPKAAGTPAASMMVEVARKFGVSPLRQMREMFALHFGPGKLSQQEYYAAGLYDPEISMAEKREYVGVKGIWNVNTALTPVELPGIQPFVANKVMFSALIDQLGIPAPETQAVVSSFRKFGNIPALSTPEDLRRFLQDRAVFPIFGKPQSHSGSYGAVLLDRIENDQLVLGDGRHVDVSAFCAEILKDYSEGYLLQTALPQHADIVDVIGQAVGTVRVVTVRPDIDPEILYCLWKIPSPKAMSDNFWQDGSMIAPVDLTNGQVGACRVGTGLNMQTVATHPVSGRDMTGIQIPDWTKVCEITRDAHAMFPQFGVFGWDVAITPDGPVIIECNDNPFHSLYQMAYGRGIRNPDFTPVLEKTAARSQVLLAEKQARVKKRKAGK